jgi:hypothetical protein
MQLRSWELRRPSAALKARLFHRQDRRPNFAVAVRWLAPAAACVFLAVTALHQESGIATGASRHDPMMAMIRSNQSPALGISNGLTQSASNDLPVGFGWTNRSDSTSSIGSFLPAR